ncbi:MAG: response regulator [Lachnospiraceae bacterium]|jgi:PAS domain S-box-containing protein|nr:response regulator [Lachnospiraceae bacterium]MCX4375635.1 response regulator [Lachnospiraceae bacterium]
MYHCQLHYYLIGRGCRAFELIQELPPMEHFSHVFSQSGAPKKELTARADIILVNLEELEPIPVLEEVAAGRKEETEIILLADNEHMVFELLPEKLLAQIKDIWTNAMSDKEIHFRLLKWQQALKTEKDNWQTNHYLEAAINSTPNLVWYKNKEGIHEKVNNSFCKTVNKTKIQVEGRGHAYIWDVEQDDPACIESENEVMTKKKTCIAEEIIQTGGGKRILTTYKSPLYNIDGSVMGTVGIAVDVTQERAYEQELIKKNHILETIFTSLDCGVICHSLDGRQIISINRAALKILGYESEEELREKGFEMISPSVVEEDRERLCALIGKLTKEGDSISVEYRVRHKDGEILHVMGNVKLLKENGELLYQRFLLDCTAQKIREKNREQHHMELVQALSIDYSLVCFYDLETGKGFPLRKEENTKQKFGDAFHEEMSYQKSMEQYIAHYVYEEDKEVLSQAVMPDKLITELSEKNICCVNYRTNGKRTEYFQLKIVRAGTWNKSRGIVLGFHSVDEEIRGEMEKKSLLEDALAQANRASKAKSVFLSNMSHDIRTPMNAIVGFTTLAITHIDYKEQVEEYLKKIKTSGEHLLSLINDVLDMSRIESGKMHLEEKPCSLPEVLHGLCNILQADVRAKQLELHMDTVDVLNEEIYCDKLRLNQVLLNLIGNSVKYTASGGVISMRVIEKMGAPEGYANYEFHIKDNGIGMSEEFVKHIFEPFEREENTTMSGIQGTGLGMAITKNIVDMMNGYIEVKSEQGVGTEFIVKFTFRLYSGMREPLVIPELKNCRALVVDDDFNTCDSVSYMLQQIGMRVEWTLSGKEAVLRTRQAVMRNDNFSVYMIDWLLPDMNGVEVTRRIRQEVGENVPIIVLTAYDWSNIEEEAKAAGVTTFCSKPLFLSGLRKCLNSVMAAENKGELAASKESVCIKTGRILLAEDNELNQEIAMAILEDSGFTVEVAGNGKIAVEKLEASEVGYYQLVLMDVQMPVMNGYEATKAIRSLKNQDLATIPIIAMTANAFEEDKQEAIRCGMNGHIAKPIDVDVLFETLRKMLS